MMSALITGFATGISLIVAIGAQNAFVLRQGLLGEHVLLVVLICAISDAVLITMGVLGASTVAAHAPWAIEWLKWGGAAFLIVYGAIAGRRAFSPERLVASRNRQVGSAGRAALICFAFTWLNPHVYVDTVGLIGAVSTTFQQPDEKIAFGGGAIAASFVFFFGLGYGARLLAPFLEDHRSWAVLEGAIAVVMWSIAATLITSVLG
jgi:L-lysine exporter family protein LysE/ArgO